MSIELGSAAGFEAIKHRQSLAPLLDAALNCRHTAAGGGMIGGLLGVMCDVMDSCQAKGVGFDLRNSRAKQIADALPAARRLLLAATCQTISQDSADVVSSLASGIFAMRDRLSIASPEPAEKGAAPVTLVQIVAMPDRQQQTDILRGDGMIVGSRTLEGDA